MEVLGPLRRFLNWERRVFLGEDEWEFPTTRDMTGLIAALDQRLKRRSVSEKRTVWSSPMRALSVHVTAPDGVEVFWNFGYWSPIPRLLGGLYFDGRLCAASGGGAIIGRFRQTRLNGAFFLLFANMITLWLALAVANVGRRVVGCSSFDAPGCETIGQALVFLGLGTLIVSFMLVTIRYEFGIALFSRPRIRALLTDLAGSGAPL